MSIPKAEAFSSPAPSGAHLRRVEVLANDGALSFASDDAQGSRRGDHRLSDVG